MSINPPNAYPDVQPGAQSGAHRYADPKASASTSESNPSKTASTPSDSDQEEAGDQGQDKLQSSGDRQPSGELHASADAHSSGDAHSSADMRDPPAADFDGLSDSRSGDFAESAPAAGDPGRADSPKDLDQELSRVRAQLQEAQSQLLRGLADMENLRKRTAIEVANAHKYAVESFAESLVPVLDSLELALKVDKPSVEALKEGAEATLRLLHTAFGKHHLLAIEPVGERFDPNRHQAISMVPGTSVTPAVAANHVVTVLQKGYLIHERVLRPALVTVAQA